jgi:hypothetical protein
MAYIGNGPGVASQRIVSTLTATDGQTSFTPTSGYTVGYVDVYLNGVKLISGTDFTASNGTNVVLTSGAATGDTLEVVAYLPRGLSDGYTKAEADARYMDINAVTLPDQTGHSGQFLQSDGTTADWATVDLTQFAAPVQLKNYTTTERNALTGLESGDTIYNSTTGSIEFYDGANWIATNLIPTVNSVTGTIYVGIATELTLSVTNATDTVTVRFSEGGATVADVENVTINSGSASVSVPAAVYGQTAGDTISVSILNQDGTPSSNAISKTVLAAPTGGDIVISGGYRYHTFTSSGSLTVSSGFSETAEYLVVAGGGAGGGNDCGGGGGAGGLLSGSVTLNSSVSITVGAGGASANGQGGDGANSSIVSLVTTIGGGGGGKGNSGTTPGRSGGSGGGGGWGRQAPGSGTSGQGFAGGWGNGSNYGGGPSTSGGGGGGAGEVGDGYSGASTSVIGHGGDGKQFSDWATATSTGVSGYYAGGGGAGTDVARSSGGAGGGGVGEQGNPRISAVNPTVNTGSGGGGGGGYSGSNGTNGASGIVIIRYQL